jgi:cytochrome c-type biogenesis protein CcmH/NrfF
MVTPSDISITLLAALVVANLGVSVAVIRARYYSPPQKLAQVLLLWLAPVVGAIGIGVLLYSQRDNTKFDTRSYPDPSEKAETYTIHESIQGHEHAP